MIDCRIISSVGMRIFCMCIVKCGNVCGSKILIVDGFIFSVYRDSFILGIVI